MFLRMKRKSYCLTVVDSFYNFLAVTDTKSFCK